MDASNSKNDEDNSLDHLVQENSQLHDQINDMKKCIKEMVTTEIHKEMKCKHDETNNHNQKLKEDLNHLNSNFHALQKERE
jgi:hypothetical protein